MRLNELEPGQKGKIAAVGGSPRFMTRVASIGLTIGSAVEVLRNEKKLPLLVYGRDTVIALNRDESSEIAVEVVS